jgi:hypothetical protein
MTIMVYEIAGKLKCQKADTREWQVGVANRHWPIYKADFPRNGRFRGPLSAAVDQNPPVRWEANFPSEWTLRKWV